MKTLYLRLMEATLAVFLVVGFVPAQAETYPEVTDTDLIETCLTRYPDESSGCSLHYCLCMIGWDHNAEIQTNCQGEYTSCGSQ